jgi:hypothetical protein
MTKHFPEFATFCNVRTRVLPENPPPLPCFSVHLLRYLVDTLAKQDSIAMHATHAIGTDFAMFYVASSDSHQMIRADSIGEGLNSFASVSGSTNHTPQQDPWIENIICDVP